MRPHFTVVVCLWLQLAQAKVKADAAEAAAAEAAAGQKTAASNAAAARGRASAAETALETALATVKELCERQALASSSKVGRGPGVFNKRLVPHTEHADLTLGSLPRLTARPDQSPQPTSCCMQEPESAGISAKPVDALAAELAAEARRRSEAEAICEELTQYNTAVIEQAQVHPTSCRCLASTNYC